MSIAIINYESGNIGSIKYALAQSGIESYLVSHPEQLEKAEHIILPGVGSFKSAMSVLNERGLSTAIKDAALIHQVPILGICLGMQLLATTGYEGGITEGLGLIPGETRLLQSNNNSCRLPHVGWNEVFLQKENLIFNKVCNESNYYFSHSYHFVTQLEDDILGKTHYGVFFASAVMKDKIIGVQFHPEKSGILGRQILKNFSLF